MLSTPAYIGRLTVSYLGSTPLGTEPQFRAARLHRRDGRRLWLEGEATVDGDRFAGAEGLLIAVRAEHFGRNR